MESTALSYCMSSYNWRRTVSVSQEIGAARKEMVSTNFLIKVLNSGVGSRVVGDVLEAIWLGV